MSLGQGQPDPDPALFIPPLAGPPASAPAAIPGYGASTFITPSGLLQTPTAMDTDAGASDAFFDKRMLRSASDCYSPLSVGQFAPSSATYDQYGFVWHWIADLAEHFALQRQTAHCAIQYAQRILRQRESQLQAQLQTQSQIQAQMLPMPMAQSCGYGQMQMQTPTQAQSYDDLLSLQQRLQILGLGCVFVAAKIEEVHPPKSAVFAKYAVERGILCTTEDLVQWEAQLLEELHWNLHPTTVLSWLLFLLSGEPAEQPLETMADFVHSTHLPSLRKDVFVAAISVIDAALLDGQALDFLPSVLAGSAILLADPGLDLVFVAQFLQLDPSLLWECKNWLIMSGCGAGALDCEGTRDEDRWEKVPEEELLFIQTRVAVPNHLAYGLLRPERSSYDFVTGTPNQVESSAFGMYSNYLLSNNQSPLSYDTCRGETYDDDASFSSASNVYHFKYGWQGGDVGYNPPIVQRRLNFS